MVISGFVTIIFIIDSCYFLELLLSVKCQIIEEEKCPTQYDIVRLLVFFDQQFKTPKYLVYLGSYEKLQILIIEDLEPK